MMHSIGAVASLSGVQIETIRYYERIGVVPRPARTSSGRRTYDAEDIVRLQFVKRCRTLEFSLADIQVSRTRFPWTQNWLNRSVQGGPEHDRQF